MATTSTPLSSQKTFSSPPKPLKSTVPSPPPPFKSSTTQLPPLDPPHRPNPPAPEPPPSTSALVPAPLPETLQSRKWTDLFAKKPWNAGVFEAPPITLQYKGNALLPSDDIYEAGKEVWRNYLVGFFLDAPLSYTVVSNHLQNLWKPSGGIKIKSTGKTFLFLLSDPEDRKRILCADPVFIRNKLFILKPWDCNAGSSTIRNVPVWIKLSNLPLYAWSKPGISWLASHIGRFVCMDAATESLDRLSFAKCLVEVTPDSLLPHEFPVMLPDDTEQLVYVEYVWRPDICDGCKSFGHKNENCSLVGSGKSNVYRGETFVGSEKNKEKDDRNANNKGGGINNQPTGRSNNPASIKQTWTKVVGRKNSAVSNTNTSMQETVSNEHGNNMVSNDIGQASVNSFNVLSDNLDSMAETQTILETEVQNLSTIVEDGEYEEVASDYDGYLDIPLPIFNEATVGPVFVQAGIAMQNDIAGKGSGCEASVTEVEEGEVRQFDVHVRNEGSLTKMTELVDEVLTFGTELSNIKSTGENSEDAAVTCQHGEVNLVVDLTDDNTKRDVHENKELSDSEQSLLKPLDVFLQQNFNLNVWQEASPTSNEDMNEEEELFPLIVQLSELLNKDLTEEGNSSNRIASLHRKLSECNNILTKFKTGELKKDWTKSIIELLKRNIREHQLRQTTPTDIPNAGGKSPYENIAPPPGHKPRPLDALSDQVSTSSSEKALPKTPITRRMKKEMMKNVHEAG